MFGMIIFCCLGLTKGSHTVTISKFGPEKFINAIRMHRVKFLEQFFIWSLLLIAQYTFVIFIIHHYYSPPFCTL